MAQCKGVLSNLSLKWIKDGFILMASSTEL